MEGPTAFWFAEVTVVRTEIKSACLKLCRDWKYRVNQISPEQMRSFRHETGSGLRASLNYERA